jgi:hypothetical protein
LGGIKKMKIKIDFTTNSSSSSFTIPKEKLSEKQILAIINHSTLGKMLGFEYSDCPWNVDTTEYFISADTIMNNFDMGDFLDKIGVNRRFVEWDEFERSYQSYITADPIPGWDNLLADIYE